MLNFRHWRKYIHMRQRKQSRIRVERRKNIGIGTRECDVYIDKRYCLGFGQAMDSGLNKNGFFENRCLVFNVKTRPQIVVQFELLLL